MTNESNLKGYNGVFATRLRDLMNGDEFLNRKKTTQEELAKATGITRQTISQYMDGSILPNIEKMFFIAKYFEVSTDYLLGLTDTIAINPNFREVCDFTGLSTQSVLFLTFLKQHKNQFKLQILDVLLSDSWLEWLTTAIYEYVFGVALQKIGSVDGNEEKKPSKWEKEIDYAKFLFSRKAEEEFEKLCNYFLPLIEETMKSLPKYKSVERTVRRFEEDIANINKERDEFEKKLLENEKTIEALEKVQKYLEEKEGRENKLCHEKIAINGQTEKEI